MSSNPGDAVDGNPANIAATLKRHTTFPPQRTANIGQLSVATIDIPVTFGDFQPLSRIEVGTWLAAICISIAGNTRY